MDAQLHPATSGLTRPQRRQLSPGTLLRRFTVASLMSTLAVGTLFGTIGSRIAEETVVRSLAQPPSVYVAEFVVLGILVLYLVLFGIVRRASDALGRQQEELQQAYVGTIESLVRAVDARDMATADHSARVAAYAEGLARELHLEDAQVQEIKAAGFLHDVGKIGIRDEILAQEGVLSEQQWAAVRRHPRVGYEILQPVPVSEAVRLAVLHSHESWDGSGYPDGLTGTHIPLGARIVAVADAYEVLTRGRPYQPAQSSAAALEEIARRADHQFDPQVVGALRRMLSPAHPTVLANTQQPA